MKEKIEYIDITPEKSIFTKLGQSGYSLSEALAELIDNSIDARLDQELLEVRIELKDNSISILDNGCGMNKKLASKLLTLGYSSKKDNSHLGKFGLGLKTSCLSIGRDFLISTSTMGVNEEYILEFNSKDWMNLGDWIKYPLIIRLAKNDLHYTNIKIDNIIIDYNNKDLYSLKKFLEVRYSPYIKNNLLKLFINDEICQYLESNIEEKFNINFNLVDGSNIHGWFGYKVVGAVKEYYGFNTYRNNRLITIYDKIGLEKSAGVRQIVGELYMDGVPVSHNKRNWIVESYQYKQVEENMKNILRDYDTRLKKILSGFSAHHGRVKGSVKVISQLPSTSYKEFQKFKDGDILVTPMTRPQHTPLIRKASAIITDQGGMLCHAAIMAREFKIPCIVGTQIATELLEDGDEILVDATEGIVYEIDK